MADPLELPDAAAGVDASDEAPTDEPEKVSFGRRSEDAEMDMTPMVDIVFQLLIFFMVTASFSLQRSKGIPKPTEVKPSRVVEIPDPLVEDLETVVVHVDENGTFLVVNADEEVAEAPSEQELLIKLRSAKASGPRGIVNRMIVKANGEAFHERVVMALDAGTAAKMERITLQTVEDEGP